MSLQLLLETSVEVTNLKSTQSDNTFNGQRITSVLLPYSVVLINVSSIIFMFYPLQQLF